MILGSPVPASSTLQLQVLCVKFMDIPQGRGTFSSQLKPVGSKENLPSGNYNWEAAPFTWKEGAARWELGYSLRKQVIRRNGLRRSSVGYEEFLYGKA